MKILYLILFINCFINAFVRKSKGDLFYDVKVKSRFEILHMVVLVALMLIATINFSWKHIIYMLLTDGILYIPIVIVLNMTVFKSMK